MPMEFDNESVRLMVLNAQDQRAAISNIAEMTGISEDEVKRIAYDKPEEPKRQLQSHDWSRYDDIIEEKKTEVMDTKTDVTPEQAEKLIEALNKSDDRENIKGWLNAVLDKLLEVGEWNTIDVHIQLDNSKGQYVEYEGAYGTN